ncbi:MAG: DUF4340 domain-containing protein [Planctomycetes bacterium]|nr:DUF4340 domain-containing protein [Planctomycetota bacterium]
MSWRTTVSLAASFAGLTLLWLALRPERPPEIKPEPHFPWLTEQYTKIEIQPRDQAEVILERRPEPVAGLSWFITKPVERPAWDPYVAEMIGSLRELRNYGPVRPGSEGYDPARAGLDKKAELVVHVHVPGQKKTIRFGAVPLQDSSQRWYMIDGDPNLYLGPAGAPDPFLRSISEIRHRGIAFFDRHRVVKIELQEHFKRAKVDSTGNSSVEEGCDVSEFEFLENPGGQRGWYWVKAGDRALQERLNEGRIYQLLADLITIQAEDFIETPDLAKYGLDKPSIKFRIWMREAGQPIEVGVGRAEKAGEKEITYFLSGQTGEVASVDSRRVEFLPRTRHAFRSTALYDFSEEEIAWIELTGEMGRVRLKREEQKWAVEHPEGFKADDQALALFVAELFAIRIKDENGFLGAQPDLKLFGLDPPGITLTVHLPGKSGASDRTLPYKFGRVKRSDTCLMKPGSDEVFATGGSVHTKLDKLELNFRDPVVFSVRRDALIEISADLEDEKELGKRHYFWIEKKNGAWAFRDAAHQGAEVDPEKLSDVLTLVNYIAAEEFLSRRREAAREYGLETNNTAGRLSVVYEDGERKTIVLKISGPFPTPGTDEKVRYGMIEGDSTVFRLKAPLVEKLKAGVEAR